LILKEKMAVFNCIEAVTGFLDIPRGEGVWENQGDEIWSEVFENLPGAPSKTTFWVFYIYHRLKGIDIEFRKGLACSPLQP
jgi:hypothetical protein